MAGKGAESAQPEKRRRGRPRKKERITSATFRLPEELRERLAKLADEEDRTQTALIRRALEAYLAEREAKESD